MTTTTQLPSDAFLDQGNDTLVMGLIKRPGHDSKYNVLLVHSLFAKTQQHRSSPALRPLVIDSKSIYPRVVSEGDFSNKNSYFCINEDERFALLLPHIGADGTNGAEGDSSSGKHLMAEFMRSACTTAEFVEYLADQPSLGNFKLCISDGSVVIFFCAVDKQAFHLRDGIWSFDAYHAGPLRHPSYVEVYFRSSLAIWQQLKGPFLSTFLQQLCLTLYQSSQKAHRLKTANVDDDGTEAASPAGTVAATANATVATATATPATTDASPCPKSGRNAGHSFVSCTTVSLKEDGGEVLQIHADLPNFNSFAFTATTPVLQRADGSGGFGAGASTDSGIANGDVGADHDFVKAKMPKKYISAFNYFSRFFRNAVKELGVKLPGAKLNEVISGAWRALNAASMKPLDELAEQSKKQYVQDVDQLHKETSGKVVFGVKRPKLKTPKTLSRQEQQPTADKQQQQQQQPAKLPQVQGFKQCVKDEHLPWLLPMKQKRHDPEVIGSCNWDVEADRLCGGLCKKARAPHGARSPYGPFGGDDDDLTPFADDAFWWDPSTDKASEPAGRKITVGTPELAKSPHLKFLDEVEVDDTRCDGTGGGDDWLDVALHPADSDDAATLAELQLHLQQFVGSSDTLGSAASLGFPVGTIATPPAAPRPAWHRDLDALAAAVPAH